MKSLRRHAEGEKKGEKGSSGELAGARGRGLMSNNTQEKGAANKVCKAETFALAFSEALRNMLNTGGLPGGREVEEETSPLEQRDIVAIGSGVVEDATPLQHNLLTDWKGGGGPSSARKKRCNSGRRTPSPGGTP